ncbi:MAG TPA: protein kinase [Anaerolineae bacterium]|nr:protein kinase [Anaerolineae bacterium]
MSPTQRIADRFLISNPEQDLLGRGSMGEVYRATDTHNGEPVAVKALDPRVVARDPGILERFVREGEALRQLSHPNIVRMVAAVEAEDGTTGVVGHYLVMEYVAGGSLRDLLEATRPDRSLPVPRVLEIGLELADALTRAHHLGIIHRDLKPANVLLAEDGTPRLTDFGIARVADSPRLTQTGVLVGTPDFLSPEACSGQALDERTDIWAFGVLLFEMLAGETPFPGESLTAKLTAILTQPVPDLGQRCPDAPEALVDLVYRMLEKDCEQRIPSMRLVGAELEAILKGREVPTTLRLTPEASRFSTPTPDATRPRHNLPAQPTPFVGREAELTELARLLGDPDVRLLTILGAGGMGKTRLALEAGAAQLGSFEHGVYFVSLAPLESVEAIVPTTAEALGFSFYEGGEPRQQLLAYLREKSKLLIMDNFEHLLVGREPGHRDGVGLVTDILQTATEVKILITSRARLNVQGETLFHLAGMDYPEPLPAAEAETPEGALDYSAVKLFLQSARRVRPGFELADDDLRYVTRICRLVQGMPLGILLAAAWLTMLSPAEIADQISGEIAASLDFLETDQRDVPDRQRSMRAVFDHSWNLLTEREQAVMQALSVFRGGFSREAAHQVADATLHELRSLVDKSLLGRDPAGRYRIHELLRQYAADKLRRAEEPAEEDSIRDAHATYYAGFLASRDALLRGKEQRQVLDEIRVEVDNIRTAWDWAITQGRIEEIERSLATLARFCRIRGWYREGEALFSRAAHRLFGTREDRSRLLQGRLLYQQGRFANLLGNESEVGRLLEASLVIFRELGAKREAAYAVCLLGGCESLYGLPRRELCLQGLSLFRELGDQRGSALALHGLAWTGCHSGEYADAKQSFQESLALFRQVGDLEGIQAALHGLGYICWILGEYQRGRELHLEMLRLCQETGSQGGIARALGDLGIDAYGLRQYEKAHELFGQSLAIYREIGDARGMCDELGDLAVAANALGNYAQAEQYAREALRVLPEGEVDFDRGAWEYRVLGSAACSLGNYADARKYLRRSLELAIAAQMPSRHLLTFVDVARVLATQSDQERALELLTLVMNHRFSWQIFKDEAAPLIAELEAELPPDVVAAAWARGRARDLDATVAELLDELGGTGTDSPVQPAPSPEGNS